MQSRWPESLATAIKPDRGTTTLNPGHGDHMPGACFHPEHPGTLPGGAQLSGVLLATALSINVTEPVPAWL
jgi:hypothetical protein